MSELMIFIFLGWLGHAQSAPAMQNQCANEIKTYCTEAQSHPEILKCLASHDKDLSTACQQELQRVAALFKDAASRGGGLGAFSAVTGSMNFGSSPVPMVNYSGSHTLGEGEPGVMQHRLNASAPIYRDGADSYALSLGASSFHFEDSPILSGTGTVVPRDFYKVEVGGQYSRQLENKRMLSARVSVGAASDELFSRFKDTIFSANASYGYPGAENSYWMLTVFISNNNPLLNYIPIPGFIYLFRSENFTGMFGLPFASLQWTPINPWALSFSLFGPSINSEISYGARDAVQGFVGFNWSPQSYLRKDRIDDEDRVFIHELRAMLGVRAPVTEKFNAELQLGQAFHRRVHEGPGLGDKDRGKTDLEDTLYAQWNLRYIF